MSAALEAVGVSPHAVRLLVAAARRASGMVVLCGPAGAGKTLVGSIIASDSHASFVADLRSPDDVADTLQRATQGAVIAVMRSGESSGLRLRWRDMGLSDELMAAACVMTVTLRRLPATPRELLVVEVIAPDGSLATGTLAEEVNALVAAGRVADDVARFRVPG